MRDAGAPDRRALPVLPTEFEAMSGRGWPGPAPAADVRIGVVTLGCDKNTVDSERILARLAASGARVGAGAEGVDVVVVNTCGFIDTAREESVEALLDAVRLKEAGQVRAVVAVGCLVQRYQTELALELPEVDLFLGLTEMERLVPELRARRLLPDAAVVPNMERPLRLLTSRARHTSYLKVSEGCDHGCAFCAIPLMRGKHRSTPPDQLIAEARELAEAGVRELNLVSQDTTWYGRDLLRGMETTGAEQFVGRPFEGMAGWSPTAETRGGRAAARARPAANRHGLLPELLTRLVAETDIPWFRLFYMYPSGIYPELVQLMAEEPRLLPYLDMPIQHGADSVLRRMRRPERQATIRERVGWLRAAIPDLTLRTTVIVGFPGETDAEFEALIDLLEEVRFDHLGAFAYSVEESTPAADMPHQVSETVKRERLERLLDVQRGISLERHEAWLGREVEVLVDEVVGRDMTGTGGEPLAPRGAVGRTPGQAPEIDGVVHIARVAGVLPGDFVRVRITEALEEDLVAEVVQ